MKWLDICLVNMKSCRSPVFPVYLKPAEAAYTEGFRLLKQILDLIINL